MKRKTSYEKSVRSSTYTLRSQSLRIKKIQKYIKILLAFHMYPFRGKRGWAHPKHLLFYQSVDAGAPLIGVSRRHVRRPLSQGTRYINAGHVRRPLNVRSPLNQGAHADNGPNIDTK